MHKILCNHCYSHENIIYCNLNFICKKCAKIIKRCDTCGLYCHDTCLAMFTNIMKISD